MVERLLLVAESEYDHAFPAIARLPGFYRRPVAVAADVYRGIHDAIRANGHDNLTRRAYTGLGAKLKLGAGALIRARKPEGAVAKTVQAAAASGLTALLLLLCPAPGGAQALEHSTATEPPGATVAERVEPMSAESGTEAALLEIGRLWVLAVDEEEAVEAGLEAVERLRSRLSPVPPALDRRLQAYRGSFTALRAKHGGWPNQRLRNLRRGFELMDGVVAEAPESADLRYIRLMSGFYLPGIFGRGGEVQEDLDALVELLPSARADFPPDVYVEVVTFLLENAELAAEERRSLESLLP